MSHQSEYPTENEETPESLQNSTIKERLTTFFRLSNDLFAEIDFKGTLIQINPAWSKTLGYPHQQIKGRQFIDFVHPSDLNRTKSLITSISSKSNEKDTTGSFKNRCRCADGTDRWFAWSWTTDLKNKRIIAIARDNTEDTEKKEFRQVLLSRIQESNEELQNFASVASHDLKEPLRMVTSYLKLLQTRYPETLDKTAQHYIETACLGADRMRTMIEDLLSYARLSNAPAESMKSIAITDILEEVLSILSVAIENEKAEIRTEIDPTITVIGNRTRLVRVFQNIISNAIKFHKKGLPPLITIRSLKQNKKLENEIHLLEVTDNGIGIDKDHISLIFKPFTRLNTRDEFEGNGIGLATCKKIIEQHSGQIQVHSEKNIGSTFRIHLKRPNED